LFRFVYLKYIPGNSYTSKERQGGRGQGDNGKEEGIVWVGGKPRSIKFEGNNYSAYNCE
jgi:hypothetical protein